MNSQHLSDEAVAAFADGVLRGHACDRATRHVEGCHDCRLAVRSQREAVLVLRSAAAPALPSGLFERLRALPATTPISTLPTELAADGSTVLSTGTPTQPTGTPRLPGGFAPMAAFAPSSRRSMPMAPSQLGPAPSRATHRVRPLATGAAVIALTAGALVASAMAQTDEPATAGPGGVSYVEGHAPVQPQLVGVRFVRP